MLPKNIRQNKRIRRRCEMSYILVAIISGSLGALVMALVIGGNRKQ